MCICVNLVLIIYENQKSIVMDQYIRDFETEIIQTYILQDHYELNEVLLVNGKSKNFNIFHNNIRSINKNFDELQIFLSNITTNIDCIVLTETWNIPNPELFSLNGYKLVYNEGRLNQNDGVVVYLKSVYEYTHKIIHLNDNRVIQIKIILGNKNTLVVNAIYRSPSTDLNEFNISLQEFLKFNDTKDTTYSIFIGDMNIDILGNDEYCQEYLSIMSEFGYLSTINCKTRVQNNNGTCIDHIFLKSKKDITNQIMPLVIQTNITDHYTTALQLILTDCKVKTDDIHYKKYINYDKLNNLLRETSWLPVFSPTSPDAGIDKFVEILTAAINNCTTTKKIKRRNTKITPWITNALVKSIDEKNKLHKRLKVDPSNVELELSYKSYRNKLANLIKKTKFEYYQNLLNIHASDSKTLWKIVQEISSTKTKKLFVSKITNDTGEIITNPYSIADEFNKAYTQLGKQMAKKITKNPNYVPQKNTSLNSFALIPTDSSEIENLINGLKQNKSPGVDDIKSEALKKIVVHIKEPLTHLFNLCLEKGVWPMSFKETLVVPIFKNGDETAITNYRPISLITHLSKIFEHVLKKRLEGYLSKYDLISKRQYGFREKVSTQDALLALSSQASSALDENKPSLCVFIDLSKAFDTVSHKLLLEDLEDIGMRDNCLKLFKSYLANRIQAVKVNGVRSNPDKIEYGVPQGSVLGPILFNIYINGMFSIKTKGEILGFADDTAIFYKANTWEELRETVEADLPLIKNWFEYKLLTINMSKTHYLIFSCNRNNKPQFDSLHLNSMGQFHTILPKEAVKYLGVYIDSHLRWDTHIDYLCRKLRMLIHKFKYLRDILQLKQLKLLYHALVESHLRYGIVTWGGALKTHIRPLETLQKKFLKIIMKKPFRYPSDKLFRESTAFDIRQLYYYNTVLQYHRVEHNFIFPMHHHNTRRRHLPQTPHVHKSVGQRSFIFSAPKIYNSLPQHLHKIGNKLLLKRELKTYIFSQPRETITKIVENKI